MKSWMQKSMPAGIRCMFVASSDIDPKYQRKGIGAALFDWGTDVADEERILFGCIIRRGVLRRMRKLALRRM